MNPGATIYSDALSLDWPDHATRDKQQLQSAAAYLHVLQSDPPGGWSADRWQQALHLRGIIYIAIRAIRNLAGGATYEVYQRRRRNRNKTTFGSGSAVAKSLPSPQAQGRDEDYTPFDDDDHPLVRLVHHPNQTETFGELSAKLVLQNRLTGVGPLWALPNRQGKPVELWSLKTPLLYPLWQRTRQYPNGAWRVNPYVPGGWTGALPTGLGAAGAVIPGEEVKRFMEPHPFIDWDGYSPLTAGDKQIDVLESIDEARKNAMDRGVVLDTYVVVPGASQETLDRLTKEMREKYGSSKNHRSFAAFATNDANSKATFQTMNARVVDMDFPEGWQQSIDFCLALFGVPPSVAGLKPSGSYSEHYASRQQFHDEQADYLESLATFYTKSLAWPWCSYPDEFLIRCKPRPVNDHELAEKKHQRQCQQSTITLDESRAKDDLPPYHDPEVGKLPVSVALARLTQQQAADRREPQLPTGQPDLDAAAQQLEPLPGSTPTGGGPPRPANPAPPGSLPPRPEVAKGFDPGEARDESGKWTGGGSAGSVADHWRGKVPHPDTVTGMPNTKKARAELARRIDNARIEALNALVGKYGTRDVESAWTPEEKALHNHLFFVREVLATGEERDGAQHLGPVSDRRYAGYYRGAVETLDKLRAMAAQPAGATKALDSMNTLSGSDGGFTVPPGDARVQSGKRKKKPLRKRLVGRVLKSLEG
jgi:hypothetical protein